MEVTFIHNGQGWWIQISNPQELVDYFNVEWKRRAKKAKAEYGRTNGGKLYHYSDTLANTCDVLARRRFITFDECLDDMRHDTFKTMYHALCEGKNIYINRNGGYNFQQKVCKTLVKDNFDFPVFTLDDIHIKKWPGGNHYYAYAGNKQIIIGDKLKWNTKEAAENAAIQFLANTNKTMDVNIAELDSSN